MDEKFIIVSMTDEEIASLTTISRSRTAPARRVARAQMLLASREFRRSLRWSRALVSIIRRCNAASSGRWPMVRWRHSMTDRIRARSRRSRRRPKLGWYLWRATRPRTTAIRMSCGRRGCWHAMPARTPGLRGANFLPTWSRARCARFLRAASGIRKSSELPALDQHRRRAMEDVLFLDQHHVRLRRAMAAAKAQNFPADGKFRMLDKPKQHWRSSATSALIGGAHGPLPHASD